MNLKRAICVENATRCYEMGLGKSADANVHAKFAPRTTLDFLHDIFFLDHVVLDALSSYISRAHTISRKTSSVAGLRACCDSSVIYSCHHRLCPYTLDVKRLQISWHVERLH
jgi:hypothetical protein